MKYIKLITQTAEQSQDSDNKQLAKKAKAQLELNIATKKSELAIAEDKVEELKRSRSFNAHCIYNAQCTVDLLNREITGYQSLLTELF